MNTQDKLAYSVEELADATGIGRTSLYSEMKKNRLKRLKFKGRTIITVEDARKWLDTIRAEQTAEVR